MVEIISHYHILKKLGSGGMGEVYLAEDTALRRKVALKFFIPLSPGAAEAKTRFKQEAQLAASLNHPNIVTIYEVDEWEGKPYISMEYVEGKTLREVMESAAGSPLPIERALDIAAQICEGLKEAHRHGITHRDLKPDNILIDKNGRVKILDFGLAKLKGAVKITKDSTRMGTPEYMSPEQITGAEVDQRTDIFSFGIILYELLSGKLPFTGERDISVFYNILNEDPRPLSGHRPEAPEWLCGVVERALQKNPAQRFSGIDEVLARLSNDATRSPISGATTALPGVPETPARRPLRSSAAFARIIAGAALLLFLLAAIFYWHRLKKEPPQASGSAASFQKEIAVMPFSVSGDAEYNYLAEGMAQLLSSKLEGAGELRVLNPRVVLNAIRGGKTALPPPELGAAVSRQLGAHYFIWGSMLAIGGKMSLEASLYAANNPAAPLAQVQAEARATELFDMVDNLAARLLAGLVDDPYHRTKRVAAITTQSLPALKAFLGGESRFRAGDYQGALQFYQEAVLHDPGFALAYYRTSLAADWLTRPDLARPAAEKAVQHSERLSESDRLLLEAFLAWQNGAAARAERLYRTIVGTNRDDIEAWYQLGEVLFHYGPLQGKSISEARQAFEQVISLEPHHILALWHLARIAAVENRPAEVSSLVDLIVKLQPAGQRELEIQALRAFFSGDVKSQAQNIKELRKRQDYAIVLGAWNVAVYAQNLEAAKQLAGLLLDPLRSPEVKALGHLILAHLALAQGRYQAARQALNTARQFDHLSALEYQAYFSLLPFHPGALEERQQLQAQLEAFPTGEAPRNLTPSIFFTVHNDLHPAIIAYLNGLLHALAQQPEQAGQACKVLENITGQPEAAALARDLSLVVQAQIAWQQNQPLQALALLRQRRPETWYGLTIASPFYSRALARFMEAELLFSLNRFEEAIPLYNSFAEYSFYDLIFLAPAQRRLGQIYEKMVQPREAAGHYRRFAELWKDCDPAFRARLEEAQNRLSALKF